MRTPRARLLPGTAAAAVASLAMALVQLAPPAAAASANGYAAQNGGTTGGTGGTTVRATTGTQIHQALCGRASTSTPIVIEVSGTINHGNTSKVSGSCNTAADVIEIKGVSNVTIVGVGSSAVFDQIGIHIRDSSNIIIQNVTVQNVKKSGSPTSNGGDAIGMESTVSNVWIDHNTLVASGGEDEGYDGLVDMKSGTKYVTVSYNILRNSGRGGLVGSSDSDTSNGPVTFHHNWYSNIESRTPLLRSATAHIYNNYYQQLTKSGINPRNGGRARVENNYFKDSKDVLGTFYTDLPGYWQTSGNILDNVTWSAADSETNPAGPSMTSNASVSVPYSYSLDQANCVPSVVQSTAGSGKGLATSTGSCSVTTQPSTTGGSTSTTTTSRPTTTATTSTSVPSNGSGLSCTTTTSAWNGGFVTSVTVKNGNSSTVSGWTATLDYGTSVGVSSSWGVAASASGSRVTVSGTDWAANIPANGSVSPGFQGTASGMVANPTCSLPGGSSTSSSTRTTSQQATTTTTRQTTTTTTRPASSTTTTTAASSSGGEPTGTNLSLGAGADGTSKASGSSYGNVVDGNLGTSWSPSGTTGRVSAKWSSAVTVGSVVIREASGSVGTIRSWQLVNNDTGATLASGTSGIGTVSFTPVSLKKINLEILAANGTPAVAEFETYGSGGSGGGSSSSSSSSSSSTRTTTTSTSSGGGSDGGTSPTASWPSATGTTNLSSTRTVSGTFDGNNARFQGWGGSQSEGQDPLFILENGAVIKNVIIGDAAGDGIHCKASCTIQNVWWEDVGEDAATMLSSGGSSATMTIDGGGARNASDKVFQHNSDGTMVVKNFQVYTFGKLIRHCGNCSTSYQRDSIIQNVVATGGKASIIGINTNWGDGDDPAVDRRRHAQPPICEWYRACRRAASRARSDPASEYCKYSASDITYK